MSCRVDNEVKVQLKSFDSYRTITKALANKSMEFHKLKEERNYRVVLKICTTQSTQKKSKLKLRN
jgi:hypothetical protein